MIPLLVLANVLATVASACRTVTVKNSCPETVWPSISGNANHEPVWELGSGSSTVIKLPADYISGRIWARTGCSGDASGGKCLTGDDKVCTGAEFSFNPKGSDIYNINLVDGFNVPLSIKPSRSDCHSPSCGANINAVCPPQLRAHTDASGANHACMSACGAGFGDEKWGNRDCCTGAYGDDPKLCGISGIDFYKVFKDACPDAFTFVNDEQSGSSLFACDSSRGEISYTVEFCPGGSGFAGSQVSNTQYASATASVSNVATTWRSELAVRATPTAPGGSPDAPTATPEVTETPVETASSAAETSDAAVSDTPAVTDTPAAETVSSEAVVSSEVAAPVSSETAVANETIATEDASPTEVAVNVSTTSSVEAGSGRKGGKGRHTYTIPIHRISKHVKTVTEFETTHVIQTITQCDNNVCSNHVTASPTRAPHVVTTTVDVTVTDNTTYCPETDGDLVPTAIPEIIYTTQPIATDAVESSPTSPAPSPSPTTPPGSESTSISSSEEPICDAEHPCDGSNGSTGTGSDTTGDDTVIEASSSGSGYDVPVTATEDAPTPVSTGSDVSSGDTPVSDGASPTGNDDSSNPTTAVPTPAVSAQETPVTEGATHTENVSVPVSAGSDVSNGNTPVSDGASPTGNNDSSNPTTTVPAQETPVADGSSPTESVSSPVSTGSDASSGESTPVNDGAVPTGNNDSSNPTTAVSGQETPVAGGSTPTGTDVSVPTASPGEPDDEDLPWCDEDETASTGPNPTVSGTTGVPGAQPTDEPELPYCGDGDDDLPMCEDTTTAVPAPTTTVPVSTGSTSQPTGKPKPEDEDLPWCDEEETSTDPSPTSSGSTSVPTTKPSDEEDLPWCGDGDDDLPLCPEDTSTPPSPTTTSSNSGPTDEPELPFCDENLPYCSEETLSSSTRRPHHHHHQTTAATPASTDLPYCDESLPYCDEPSSPAAKPPVPTTSSVASAPMTEESELPWCDPSGTDSELPWCEEPTTAVVQPTTTVPPTTVQPATVQPTTPAPAPAQTTSPATTQAPRPGKCPVKPNRPKTGKKCPVHHHHHHHHHHYYHHGEEDHSFTDGASTVVSIGDAALSVNKTT